MAHTQISEGQESASCAQLQPSCHPPAPSSCELWLPSHPMKSTDLKQEVSTLKTQLVKVVSLLLLLLFIQFYKQLQSSHLSLCNQEREF